MGDYISWNSALQTGISLVDRQHRRIIADINDLHAISQETDERAVLADVINQMVDYMVKHFAFEEALLNEAGYEFLRAHERMHLLLLKHLDEYHSRFRAGENVLPEILSLRKTWWEHHLAHEDADYVLLASSKFCGGDPLATEWLSAALKMHFAGREA